MTNTYVQRQFASTRRAAWKALDPVWYAAARAGLIITSAANDADVQTMARGLPGWEYPITDATGDSAWQWSTIRYGDGGNLAILAQYLEDGHGPLEVSGPMLIEAFASIRADGAVDDGTIRTYLSILNGWYDQNGAQYAPSRFVPRPAAQPIDAARPPSTGDALVDAVLGLAFETGLQLQAILDLPIAARRNPRKQARILQVAGNYLQVSSATWAALKNVGGDKLIDYGGSRSALAMRIKRKAGVTFEQAKQGWWQAQAAVLDRDEFESVATERGYAESTIRTNWKKYSG